MPRLIFDHTKKVLEKVSFDVKLFVKELYKALKSLLPYEIEHLRKWLDYFTIDRPDLKQYVSIVQE
ncbi:hypothetical protein [Flavobacterium sp.]|uniref:hypothetical protein n=1 Tax=Flavobacterium sp. TaxID=239 RepID=UPI003D0E7030